MIRFASIVSSTPNFKLSERKLVLIGVVAMLAAFGLVLIFVGGGAVRHVPIYWKEKVEATVAFKSIDDKLKVIGTKGNSQVNPTVVSRTGDTAYVLTVINNDAVSHMFYFEGLNVHIKLLRAGENDTITIYSKQEGTYNYYDRLVGTDNPQSGRIEPIGQFKALRVAGDEWS